MAVPQVLASSYASLNANAPIPNQIRSRMMLKLLGTGIHREVLTVNPVTKFTDAQISKTYVF